MMALLQGKNSESIYPGAASRKSAMLVRRISQGAQVREESVRQQEDRRLIAMKSSKEQN